MTRHIAIAFLAFFSAAHGLARELNLDIADYAASVDGIKGVAMSINNRIPGPLLRFTEGEEVAINVTNHLDEPTSIHWHGIILPAHMDGVPHLSFPGIEPGEIFTYTFRFAQSGTYWYHSHSALQEQSGIYGPIIIDPKQADPFQYDREYVIFLSAWTPENPHRILANLKRRSDYYNYNKRTVVDFFREILRAPTPEARKSIIDDRRMWGQMRMDPTDIADVSGYTFLMNGMPPSANWSARFNKGERVRLRVINGSAMTYFDFKIPGLELTIVQADGQNVEPLAVPELRIAVAETYDLIVEPEHDRIYPIFAQAMDRSGFALGTLAARPGAKAAAPPMDQRPLRTMAHGEGGAMQKTGMHEHMHHAAPASPHPYHLLRALAPNADRRPPDREVVLRLTGNMERYFWSINGKKYGDAAPLRFGQGERVRFVFKNETMMEHPMHLHGMWMELQNGAPNPPRKHTINVDPGATVVADVTMHTPGQWALHCHLLLHMETGMFRKIVVADKRTLAGPLGG